MSVIAAFKTALSCTRLKRNHKSFGFLCLIATFVIHFSRKRIGEHTAPVNINIITFSSSYCSSSTTRKMLKMSLKIWRNGVGIVKSICMKNVLRLFMNILLLVTNYHDPKIKHFYFTLLSHMYRNANMISEEKFAKLTNVIYITNASQLKHTCNSTFILHNISKCGTQF